MFVGHYVNISMFYHSHVVDGVTYSHSHFYGFGSSKNNPISLPQHSQEQLKLIQDFNNITWNSDIVIPQITGLVLVLLNIYSSPEPEEIPLENELYYSLRAPPSFVLV